MGHQLESHRNLATEKKLKKSGESGRKSCTHKVSDLVIPRGITELRCTQVTGILILYIYI